MEITKLVSGDTLTFALKGRLDTLTSPDFSKAIDESVANVKHLILDLGGIDYVSSAGLRVILTAQKIMFKQGDMIVKNVNDEIRSLFEMTGFSEILTIE